MANDVALEMEVTYWRRGDPEMDTTRFKYEMGVQLQHQAT